MDALDKLGISWQLLLSQIINFGLLMVILHQLLYKPVLNMLEQRRQRIAQGLEQADKASHAAAEAEAEKQGILEEARREAQEVRGAGNPRRRTHRAGCSQPRRSGSPGYSHQGPGRCRSADRCRHGRRQKADR